MLSTHSGYSKNESNEYWLTILLTGGGGGGGGGGGSGGADGCLLGVLEAKGS